MTTCHYDREAETYVTDDDGSECRRDDYGDPTHHCTARRTCSLHIGRDELTCARCLGRARTDLAQIVERAALMPAEAEETGVESEAASLAGPAADVEAWTWRKVAARQGRAWHVSLVEDDDDQHPYTVLTRWEFMLREDYSQPRPIVGCRTLPDFLGNDPAHRRACAKDHGPGCWSTSERPTSITEAGDYLSGILGRIAQDPAQDFALLARELRRCRSHLEAVLRDSRAPERGAPCPDCLADGRAVRLNREYGHWCYDGECERIHYLDDSGDRWVCPRNRAHAWSHRDYENWIEERQQARAGA